jgi:hypothetical protein
MCLTWVAEALHALTGGVQQIYMYDSDVVAHKARLCEYKEPAYDYDRTATCYSVMANTNDFACLTFQEAVKKWT